MGVGRQLRYLLYRNYLLKRRNIKQTTYEVVSVLYFIAILAVIRLTAVKPTTEDPVYDARIPKLSLYSHFNFTKWPPKTIGYTFEDGSQIQTGESILLTLNSSLPSVKFTKFKNAKELEDEHRRAPSNMTYGLVIDASSSNMQVKYTIKTPYTALPDPSPINVPKGQDKCRDQSPLGLFRQFSCPVNSYYVSGFSILQSYVEAAIIEIVSNQKGYLAPEVTIQMAPKDKFTTTLDYLKNLVSIYMVIAFSPYIMFLLTFIVNEKEKKIKEAMKIMGLNMYVFWLGWFITYAVVISIGVLLVTIIAVAAKVFGDSNFVLLLIIFLLYGLSIETLSFMLTPLFTKAKSAGTAGSVITIILSPISLLHIYVNTSNAVKWLTCFLSPVALSLALIPALEDNNGLSWSNVATKGDFPAIYAMIMLLIDVFLYLALAIYLDAVFPGEYGIRRHPLFCLRPSYWRTYTKQHKTRRPSLMRSMSVKSDEPEADVEDVPVELRDRKVISIRNIAKVFKKRGKEDVKALNGVSLDVYEGQITALLGHNGAGKSTLIALLTGLLPTSSGKAIIYGFNINSPDGLDKIREILGLCPQQDIVFEALTPEEHLNIYAGIKGIDPKEISSKVTETLQEIDLWEKKDTIAKNLSGGQKRKLCVGIALIGDPKVVFLDEPTSGMDPASRRKMWSLLQRKKEGRVIFLTTHFMDEADILADYKAIISKGRLRCAGSSLYLKNRFGIGYHLGMVVDPAYERNRVVDMVQDRVPGAEISREHSKELAFKLPLAAVDKFPDLFSELEKYNETGEPCTASGLGVITYGVSMTTLEEVFLKLDDENSEKPEQNGTTEDEALRRSPAAALTAQEHGKNGNLSVDSLYNESTDLHAAELDQGKRRIPYFALQQFLALLEIRAWLTIRSYTKILFQVVIPPIFIIVGLVLLNNNKSTDVGTAKTIDIKPSLYLKQGGSENFPSFLVKNGTSGPIDSFMIGLNRESLKYELAKNLSKLLDVKPHTLAVDLVNLPPAKKLMYLLRYNDSAIYSIPVGINTISNVLLRRALAASGKQYDGEGEPIQLKSQTFEPIKPPWKYDYSSYVAVLLISMCFCLMPGGFAVQVVAYREIGMRHQLRVNGTNRLVYWLQFVLGDMFLYIFPVTLVFILIPAFDIHAFNSSPAAGLIGLLLILYIPTSLLFAYCLSFLFNKWETVQNVFGTIFIFLGIIPYTAVSTIDMVAPSIDGYKVAHILHIVFLLIDPPYAIYGGLYYISRVWRVQSILAQKVEVSIPASKYYELVLQNGIPATLIVLSFHLLFLCWLLWCLDSWKAGGISVFPFSFCSRKRVSRPSVSTHAEGEEMNADVKRERERVSKVYLDNQAPDKSVLVQGNKSVVVFFGSRLDTANVGARLATSVALVNGLDVGLGVLIFSQNTTRPIGRLLVYKQGQVLRRLLHFLLGLTKDFGKKRVVDDVYFCVDQGEILGLLGPNGAGKTTTLNMVTADFQPTKGMIFVGGYNVKSDLNKAFQSLGYCPQSGALWDLCTVREHLKCFALLKGVPRKHVNTIIDHYMLALKITEHADKKEKEISGGTKRKLSFLISMMGQPNTVLFDEPSTGMDPAARRTAISRNIKEQRGAILTTHSMEEADALCSRVGIIVKGKLRCIGTTQELKTNYGGGYQLEVKGKRAESDSLEESSKRIETFVREMFPSAVVMESFGARVTFKIPNKEVTSLSEVFRKFEEGKSTIDIEEYSFSQSSLEQVFLEFAREQDDELTGTKDANGTATQQIPMASVA